MVAESSKNSQKDKIQLVGIVKPGCGPPMGDPHKQNWGQPGEAELDRILFEKMASKMARKIALSSFFWRGFTSEFWLGADVGPPPGVGPLLLLKTLVAGLCTTPLKQIKILFKFSHLSPPN